MPGEVPAEKESPYLEKLKKRPDSARTASVVSPRSDTQQQPKSARCKSAKTRKTSPDKHRKKKKSKDEMEKEISKVSKEVKHKLELYMNKERRQNRFNVSGHSTTTHRMAEFDIAYKVLEYDQLERKSPRNPKVGGQSKGGCQSKSADPYDIQPKLKETSRRVTGYSEADRLSKYASEVFSSYPVEKLAQIHRYRPHPKDNAKSPELGNVLGYTGHVGAALHQQNYVDFYIREGMDSGDPRQSSRLKNLPKMKASHTNSRRTSDASSKKNDSQDSKHHEKKVTKSKVASARKSKPGKTRKVSKSTEASVDQSVQDDNATVICSSKEDDHQEQDESKDSKDSLNETDGNDDNESKSTHDQDSEENDDKTNTTDHMTDDGYTYSDGENNNNPDQTEDSMKERYDTRSDTRSGKNDTSDDESEISEKDGEKKRDNELITRSYTSVEHVREVDISDI